MGSPLIQALADIFMSLLIDEVKKKTIISFTIYQYVDDLFLAFDNQIKIDVTFN